MNDRKNRWTSNINYFIVALIIALVFAFVFFWLSFFTLVYLFPSVTHFEGREHPVMPMGQFLLSVLLAIIASVVVLVIAFRKIKRKFTTEKSKKINV